MNTHPFTASPEQLETIARQYGTPLYCYDADLITARCRRLRQAFSEDPVTLLYAVKANDNPHILKRIADEGFGFDTVSFEEVLLGLRVGVKPEHIFYTENNMTDQEMTAAVDAGVVLNIGSYSRLEAFCRHVTGMDAARRTCSIRVNPAIGDGHHAKVVTGNRDSKFGIRLDLIPAAVERAASHGVHITGLHIHIGSGIRKPENLLQAMKVLITISHQLPDLDVINFGGGFPVPYRSGDDEFSIERFAALARPVISEEVQRRGGRLRVIFEPGRWIVAPAGLLLTRANTVKDQGRIQFIGTDTGFNHLVRPVLYDAWHEVRNITRSDAEATQVYTIAGNICESGDILAEDRRLPETQPGDLLALCDTGAYGMTMASHYNRRPLPAEVLLERDGSVRLIRRRESAVEIVDRLMRETDWGKG